MTECKSNAPVEQFLGSVAALEAADPVAAAVAESPLDPIRNIPRAETQYHRQQAPLAKDNSMRYKHMAHKLPAVLVSIGMSCLVHAGNRITNPDFSTGVAGWSVSTEFPGARFELDTSDGSPAAPSAMLSPGPGLNEADSECILVTAGRYDLFVNLKPGLNDYRVHAGVIAYADELCMAYISGLADTQSTVAALSNGWYQQSAVNFLLPAGTQSIRVALTNNMPGPIHFDHVRFGPAGTTPVALQSFNED